MTYFISDEGCMHGNKYKNLPQVFQCLEGNGHFYEIFTLQKNLHGILCIQPEWKEQNKLTFIVK